MTAKESQWVCILADDGKEMDSIRDELLTTMGSGSNIGELNISNKYYDTSLSIKTFQTVNSFTAWNSNLNESSVAVLLAFVTSYEHPIAQFAVREMIAAARKDGHDLPEPEGSMDAVATIKKNVEAQILIVEKCDSIQCSRFQVLEELARKSGWEIVLLEQDSEYIEDKMNHCEKFGMDRIKEVIENVEWPKRTTKKYQYCSIPQVNAVADSIMDSKNRKSADPPVLSSDDEGAEPDDEDIGDIIDYFKELIVPMRGKLNMPNGDVPTVEATVDATFVKNGPSAKGDEDKKMKTKDKRKPKKDEKKINGKEPEEAEVTISLPRAEEESEEGDVKRDGEGKNEENAENVGALAAHIRSAGDLARENQTPSSQNKAALMHTIDKMMATGILDDLQDELELVERRRERGETVSESSTE